jgi:hypothetical protein
VKAEPWSLPNVNSPGSIPCGRVFDRRDRFIGAAAQLELPRDDLKGAAVNDR